MEQALLEQLQRRNVSPAFHIQAVRDRAASGGHALPGKFLLQRPDIRLQRVHAHAQGRRCEAGLQNILTLVRAARLQQPGDLRRNAVLHAKALGLVGVMFGGEVVSGGAAQHRIDKPRSAGFPHLPRERDGFADGRAHRHALQITRLIQPAAQNGAHRRIQLYQRLLQEFLQDMVQRHHTLYGAVEHGAEKCPVPRCSGEAVQRMAQYKVCVTVLFLFYQRGHGRAAGILHSCSFDSLPQPQAARALRACLFLYTAKAGNLLQFAGFAV